MRARLLLPLLLLALVLAADARAKDYIVGYEDSVSSPDRATDRRERAQGFAATYRYDAALEGFAADLDPSQAAALRADPQVAFVVPDRPVRAVGPTVALAPGDSVPTGVRRIGAASGTAVSPPADGAVAVLDTGVGPASSELDVQPGTNCVGPGPPDDDNGHGTHVAGTIAARNDGSGVVGVAPGTRIVPVKVLDEDGHGATSQVVCGLDWVTANAAARGIVAANLSLGGSALAIGTCTTDPERAAICRASLAGVTVVAAAGNDARDIGAFPFAVPAGYPEVLTATAFADSDGAPGGAGAALCDGERDDTAASFSNYATRPDDLAHVVAAPGVCIRSTWPGGGAATASGTSMAAPHVAGVVALCNGAGGVPGACAGLAPREVIATVRAVAARSGALGAGFAAAPTAPVGAQWGDALRVTDPADAATPAASPAPATGETPGRTPVARVTPAAKPAVTSPPAAEPPAGPAGPAASPPASAPPRAPRGPSRACLAARRRLASARTALAGVKRAAKRRPTKANRARVKRAAGKVSTAKGRTRRKC